MNKQSLQRLRDMVAAGEWDCLDANYPLPAKSYPDFGHAYEDSSLDAAVAFLEAVLPDWDWMSAVDAHGERYFVLERTADDYETEETYGDTPARALLLATLDALIEGAG